MAKPKSTQKPTTKPSGKPDPGLSRNANINRAILGQMARSQDDRKK